MIMLKQSAPSPEESFERVRELMDDINRLHAELRERTSQVNTACRALLETLEKGQEILRRVRIALAKNFDVNLN